MANHEQLFWMQAIDNPPAWFASTMTKAELQQMKQNWLRYHARKTEGILSICPCCYNMPLRITHGNGYLYKEYGVHNGATCILKGWELHDKDLESPVSHGSRQIVLQALPKTYCGDGSTVEQGIPWLASQSLSIVTSDSILASRYRGRDSNCSQRFPCSP